MLRLRSFALSASLALVIGIMSSGSIEAANDKNLQVIPGTFVGLTAGCAPFPPGSHIVTAAWLSGMGLPDNGGPNTSASRNDPHFGLLLSKNGPQADCSSAGADVKGLKQGSTLTELGFDYRNGGHCGAGAPRFNVTDTSGTIHFFGCGDGNKSTAPQDPTQWSRVRFDDTTPGTGGFVFGPSGTKVKSIEIIFDEGTDIVGTEDPNGVGLAVIDNIDVNGTTVTRGPSGGERANGDKDNGDKNDDHDDNGNNGTRKTHRME